MKSTIMKTKTSLIAIILLLSMVAIVVTSSTVDVAVTTYNSYIYLPPAPKSSVSANSILLVAWTADIPPDIGETAGTVVSPSGRAGWTGMQINLTSQMANQYSLTCHTVTQSAPTISLTHLMLPAHITFKLFSLNMEKHHHYTIALSCCSQHSRQLHRTERTNTILG